MAKEVEDQKIKLISSDGMVFEVTEAEAKVSNTLRAMLESNFLESKSREIKLSEIKGKVLEKVVEYLKYKIKYEFEENNDKIPTFPIEDNLAVELVYAANYLDC